MFTRRSKDVFPYEVVTWSWSLNRHFLQISRTKCVTIPTEVCNHPHRNKEINGTAWFENITTKWTFLFCAQNACKPMSVFAWQKLSRLLRRGLECGGAATSESGVSKTFDQTKWPPICRLKGWKSSGCKAEYVCLHVCVMRNVYAPFKEYFYVDSCRGHDRWIVIFFRFQGLNV